MAKWWNVSISVCINFISPDYWLLWLSAQLAHFPRTNLPTHITIWNNKPLLQLSLKHMLTSIKCGENHNNYFPKKNISFHYKTRNKEQEQKKGEKIENWNEILWHKMKSIKKWKKNLSVSHTGTVFYNYSIHCWRACCYYAITTITWNTHPHPCSYTIYNVHALDSSFQYGRRHKIALNV